MVFHVVPSVRSYHDASWWEFLLDAYQQLKIVNSKKSKNINELKS
ncbi:MAG: hypothetical protein CLLPBCKN_003377 [Chroococcidiopsis cubana SAG 39.79]|nr:hypothetical protein [Chroococcidiopsis cubana SAG 39.79]